MTRTRSKDFELSPGSPILPVIDLLTGCVVRAVGGRRSEYRPIKSVLCSDSQPAMLATTLRQAFDFDAVYVADLDAIGNRSPNVAAWIAIQQSGLRMVLDAGIGSVESAEKIAAWMDRERLRAVDVVVGLESIESLACLPDIFSVLQEIPKGQPTFSLDLRHGKPLFSNSDRQGPSAEEIARLAIGAGFRKIIVLDVSAVGENAGPATLWLCQQLRSQFTNLRLISGGGVRSLDDVRAFVSAGCNEVLVASALHDGRISPASSVHSARKD